LFFRLSSNLLLRRLDDFNLRSIKFDSLSLSNALSNLKCATDNLNLTLDNQQASLTQFKDLNISDDTLSHYIAGLIEGDGSIKVPNSLRSDKNKLLYPSVTIVFVDKDLPLANALATYLKGTVNKAKGNYYILSIYSLSALYNFAGMVNGKFRTPKIEALHRLITWLNNNGKFDLLELKGHDNSDLFTNSWLAGFSDCDSNFLITFNLNESIAKNIQLTFRISQKQDYQRNISTDNSETLKDQDQEKSYLPILTSIATALNSKVTSFERNRIYAKRKYFYIEKGYLVTAKSLNSRLEVINYFTKFPLLSSKHMDYLNWYKAHEIVKSKKYRTIEGTTELIKLKSSMNSLRTEFNWKFLEQVFKSREVN
jgi:hypothetical protein